MSDIMNTTTKYIDTHLRVNTELRSFLNTTQEIYNSEKHEETPHMSKTALCNMAIIYLKDTISVFNTKEEAMQFLSELASKYNSLQAQTEYIYEFKGDGELHG